MIRRLLVLLGLFFLFSISAEAQNSMDFFGGSSYEGLGRLPQAIPARNLSGVKVAVQYNFREWLGVEGEVDGHFSSQPPARALNILVGPQIWPPRRIFLHFFTCW
jgi:hypothetical protein